jgi:hypothetical protein
LLILQEYFYHIIPSLTSGPAALAVSSGSNNASNSNVDVKNQKYRPKSSSMLTANSNSNNNNKEFLVLYKSNQLHIIQDFLFKITNLKVTRIVADEKII